MIDRTAGEDLHGEINWKDIREQSTSKHRGELLLRSLKQEGEQGLEFIKVDT